VRFVRQIDTLQTQGLVDLTPLAQRFAMENLTLSIFRRDLGVSAPVGQALFELTRANSSFQRRCLQSTSYTLRSRGTYFIPSTSAFHSSTAFRFCSLPGSSLVIAFMSSKLPCWRDWVAKRSKGPREVLVLKSPVKAKHRPQPVESAKVIGKVRC